ncbi:MAG: metallophosphoesterase [Oscillospiraceae bacterium]|nr:metallophosphoesterase [Oscillospiraceae bacterium]
MRVFVFSDSHGAHSSLPHILNQDTPDLAVHLGDHADDAAHLSKTVNTPILWVAGNCDPFSSTPHELTVEWEGHTVYLCHGHTHRVKSSLLALSYAAQEHGASLALFGHTHTRCDETYNGIRLINPGAVKQGSYAVLTVTTDSIACEFKQI